MQPAWPTRHSRTSRRRAPSSRRSGNTKGTSNDDTRARQANRAERVPWSCGWVGAMSAALGLWPQILDELRQVRTMLEQLLAEQFIAAGFSKTEAAELVAAIVRTE